MKVWIKVIATVNEIEPEMVNFKSDWDARIRNGVSGKWLVYKTQNDRWPTATTHREKYKHRK